MSTYISVPKVINTTFSKDAAILIISIFYAWVGGQLNFCLPIKKPEVRGDRIIRFTTYHESRAAGTFVEIT